MEKHHWIHQPWYAATLINDIFVSIATAIAMNDAKYTETTMILCVYMGEMISRCLTSFLGIFSSYAWPLVNKYGCTT